MKRKTKANITIIILLLLLLFFVYIYINIPATGGGGVVSPGGKDVGGIRHLFSIYGPGRGERPAFNKPMSVATDKENNIYVTDSGNDRVVVFNRKGEYLFEFGGRGVAYPAAGTKATWKPGTFNFPYGIAVDQETGNIFVGDMNNKRIQVFDKNGKFLDWFPKEPYGGWADEIFPYAITVHEGKVYITNPYYVSIFTTDGKFVIDFGMPGREPGQFDRPNGIAVGKDGTIYVSDSNNTRLQALDDKGKVKWVYGEFVNYDDFMKKTDRKFQLPRNIAVGPDGNIYVIDAFDFTIKVLSPDGKLLARMGRRGTEDGTFNFPNGIAVAQDKTIYVADKENNRVQALRIPRFIIQEDSDF